MGEYVPEHGESMSRIVEQSWPRRIGRGSGFEVWKKKEKVDADVCCLSFLVSSTRVRLRSSKTHVLSTRLHRQGTQMEHKGHKGHKWHSMAQQTLFHKGLKRHKGHKWHSMAQGEKAPPTRRGIGLKSNASSIPLLNYLSRVDCVLNSNIYITLNSGANPCWRTP